jgi:hypothetical protein
VLSTIIPLSIFVSTADLTSNIWVFESCSFISERTIISVFFVSTSAEVFTPRLFTPEFFSGMFFSSEEGASVSSETLMLACYS